MRLPCLTRGEGADLLDDGSHRQVRHHLAVRQTLPAIPCHLVWRQTTSKFHKQPRLADPWRTYQANHLTRSGPYRLQAVV
jgi:hypothetical protein